jgi:hypothetical protein
MRLVLPLRVAEAGVGVEVLPLCGVTDASEWVALPRFLDTCDASTFRYDCARACALPVSRGVHTCALIPYSADTRPAHCVLHQRRYLSASMELSAELCGGGYRAAVVRQFYPAAAVLAALRSPVTRVRARGDEAAKPSLCAPSTRCLLAYRPRHTPCTQSGPRVCVCGRRRLLATNAAQPLCMPRCASSSAQRTSRRCFQPFRCQGCAAA